MLWSCFCIFQCEIIPTGLDMDRMLGNQYFMARNYSEAIPWLEKASEKYPEDLRIIRKQIICHIAAHSLDKAISILKKHAHQFSDMLFRNGLADANCPCPDLLDNWKNRKLRLLYEAAPLSFIIEQAGGLGSTGTERILDIQPSELHQRCPLVIGCKADVELAEKYLSEQ